MKRYISDNIKCRILVCVLLIEAVFSGYVPANAACVSENTVISENTVAKNEFMPEIQVVDEKNAGSFAGANGETGNLQWNITEHGHLTISGTGDYNDVFVNHVKMPPWCEYADYIYTANVKISAGITDMSGMFSNCNKLTSVVFNDSDLSQVTDMSWMFHNCYSLMSVNLSNLNTSNVTDMTGMFYNCSSLLNVEFTGNNFDTSNVTRMNAMFTNCSSLEELDLSGFKTMNVTAMEGMFCGCKQLKKITLSKENFKTANVTNMAQMFRHCYKLESLDLSGFDTGNVTDMHCMFEGCNAIEELDLRSFETGNVKNMSNMFSACSAVKNIFITPSKFKTHNITSMSCMFLNCFKLEKLDVSGFNTSNVTDMHAMFSGCNTITELDVSSFKTAKVKDMENMFSGCCSLTELNLESFETDNVTTMYSMFNNCKNIQTLNLNSFDTKNVTDMSWMFANMQLHNLDLSVFDTSNVTNMSYMFYSCQELKRLKINNFMTDNVTKMDQMFTYCHSVKELDLSSFNTSKYDKATEFVLEMNALEKLTTGKDKRTYTLKTSAIGWHDDFGNRYSDDIGIELASNTTLYRLADTYNISYIYEGNLADAQKTYKLDNTLQLTGYVTKDHYTFDGWYTDAKYTKKITEITAGTYGDITLYAKMIPDTYSITYKNVEDILNTEQLTTSYVYGIEMIPVVPTKNCFIFDGWYLDEDLTKVFTGISSTTSGDLELYAKWKENHDLDKENGVVIKEATTISEGEIRYQCKHCSYTETEKIPRIVTQESQITDETILNKSDDSDMEGSDFTKFQARASKTTKNSICLKWNKIKDADGYKIYGNKCGKKNQYEFIKTVKGANKTTWTHKKRKKGTYYKYIVRAYKIVDGQEITLSVSKTIHATTTGGKKGNAKSLKIKTDKKCKKTKSGYTLTLKKGKKYTFKASEVAAKKKIDIHRRVRFESTNIKIATVSSKGVVKTKNPGTCYIYAYAQNGVYKKIKVVVK